MKTYQHLVESLPSKTIVFVFGHFNPPTTNHQLLIQFAKKVAVMRRADCIICASDTQDSKKAPLSITRKLHYLNVMFPDANVVSNSGRTITELAAHLNAKYKNLIMITGSDCRAKYKHTLDKYNNNLYKFNNIEVISSGEPDPDHNDFSNISPTKMWSFASKGDFTSFRKGLPPSMREIDARRLMNDVRDGFGLSPVKEHIKFTTNQLRERYFQGQIFNIGDIVESLDGAHYVIVKRGTNHLLVKDSAGNLQSKWIHEVFEGCKNDQ